MKRLLAPLLAGWLAFASCAPAQALTAGQRIAILTAGTPCDIAGQAVVVAMTTAPTFQRRKLVCKLVSSLESAGVWSKLDAFYVTAASTAQAARINWISPGTNDLAAVNAPSFTPDRGYAGDGATSYLTGINPTGATHFALNSALLGFYSLTSGSFGSAVGWSDGTQAATVANAITGTAFAVRINNLTLSQTANTNGVGLFEADRSGASALAMYRNGVSVLSDTVTSVGVTNNTLNIDHAGAANFSPVLVAEMHVGSHLTAAQHAALYSALLGYLAPIGASQ